MHLPRRIAPRARAVALALAIAGGLLTAAGVQVQSWTEIDSGTTANLWGIAYRPQHPGEPPGGLVVAVGEQGTILTSHDEGLTWIRRQSGVNTWLTAVTHDSTLARFFAVGDAGVILSSTDGIAWSREASPTTTRLNGIARSLALPAMCAIGEAGAGLLVRDATGVWTQTDAGFGNRWMRCFLNGFAVGEGGAIFAVPVNSDLSPLTTLWPSVSSPVTADLEAATDGDFFGGRPIAVGADGTIVQLSRQGAIARASGTTERLRGVCYKSGGFVRLVTLTQSIGVGEYFAVGSRGTILRSADNITWRSETSPTQLHLNGVADSTNAVIAIGDRGTILRLGGAGSEPRIARQPFAAVDSDGTTYAEGEAVGAGAMTYLWVQLSHGLPFPIGSGYPRQSLMAIPFTPVDPTFQLVIGNAFGVVRSVPFTLNRFVNLAGRATVGVGERALISGFVIGTTLPIERRVLIRGVGPALAAFGVLDELEVPRLSVFKGSQLIATNAGWSRSENAAEIRDAGQRAGAFPLADGSADTAVLLSLAPGDYTAQITGAGDSTGTALVEIYDLEAPDRTRLKNLSVRARVAPGEHTLVGGLVIDGGVEKTVLLRAAGPALAAFAVDDFLRRPLLTVFRNGTAIATGAAWSVAANAAEIRETTTALNAFAFSDGSDDAALLLRLAPGAYTVQVAGVDGGSGVALLEIYESRPTVRPPSGSSND